MNVLDLFSGACGGWSLGLHRAGFRTVAAVEIDEWRRRQFARNFPDARLYDDVRTVTAERLAADGIGPIDLVCGSPPCQDASSANTKGRGIDGERTGLYLEAVRIVREIRPRWCSFENVPGIRNRGIDRVLGELETAGYAAWPLVVGALDLGAPHIRQRSWVVCADAETVHRLAQPWDQSDGNLECAAPDAGSIQLGQQPRRSRRQGGAGAPEPVWCGQGNAADTDEAGRALRPMEPSLRETEYAVPGRAEFSPLERAIGERVGAIAETWNGGIAGRCGVDAGIPKGLARPLLTAYGDAILPQISEIIGHAIMKTRLMTAGQREKNP